MKLVDNFKFENSEVRSQQENLQRKSDNQERFVQELISQRDQLDKECNELHVKNADLGLEVSNLTEQLEQIQSERDSIQLSAEEWASAAQHNQELLDQRKVVVRSQVDISAVEPELAELQLQLASTQEALADCQSLNGQIAKERDELGQQLDQLRPILENAQLALVKFGEQRQELDRQLADREQEVEQLRSQLTEGQPATPTVVNHQALVKFSEFITERELAKRLGVSKTTLNNHKTRADFPEWSQARDPEGVAWCYDARLQKLFRCSAS